MKRKKNSVYARLCLHILGFVLCVLPPTVCTLSYFPIWRDGGVGHCIAGGSALLLVLCALPLFKLLASKIASFSSYFVWLLLFLLFFSLSKIADEMTVISLVGFIGNLLGAICFWLGGTMGRDKQ